MNQIPNINHIANGEDRLLVHNGEVIPNIECKYCHGHDCPECDALPNIEEEYTSHKALKEWEEEKDQNNLTQNIVALLGIHGMHCKYYEYQNASHLTKAFEDLFHHQLQKAREEERERISRSVNDKERQEQILANLLLRIAGVGIDFEIADSDLLTDYVVFETRPVDRYSTIYRVERNCMLDHSELDQDPVHDFFTAPEEVKRPVYERALEKTQEEQEKKLDQEVKVLNKSN
jgi:hypothetical protein